MIFIKIYSGDLTEPIKLTKGFPVVKKLPACAGDAGLILGWRGSSGGGNGNPLQYSCQENPMDREPGGLQPIGPQELKTTEAAEHTRGGPSHDTGVELAYN